MPKGRPPKNPEMIARFTKNFKRIRANKFMTLETIATGVGVNFQACSHWNNGRTMPTQKNLQRLADFFEVSRDELLKE